MAKFVGFTRRDGRSVMVNSDYVVSLEPYRDNLSQTVIFLAALNHGGQDARNYIVEGEYRAIAKLLESPTVSDLA